MGAIESIEAIITIYIHKIYGEAAISLYVVLRTRWSERERFSSARGIDVFISKHFKTDPIHSPIPWPSKLIAFVNSKNKMLFRSTSLRIYLNGDVKLCRIRIITCVSMPNLINLVGKLFAQTSAPN